MRELNRLQYPFGSRRKLDLSGLRTAHRAAAGMSTPEQMVESLRKEVVALRSRLKEVDLENNDLRNLCTANGINYEETLATKRQQGCSYKERGRVEVGKRTPNTGRSVLGFSRQ